MPQPYRLTINENGLIDRMVPFFALKADAVAFADGQRFGRHAVLLDTAGLVKMFPSDAVTDMAAHLRRLPPQR